MPPNLSELVSQRVNELGLTLEQVAIAAGLHKTTVYRIARGVTTTPRPVTLRKLARALAIPITELTDQIELEALQAHFEPNHPLAGLLVSQFDLLPDHLRVAGAAAAVSALLDVEAGLGGKGGVPRRAEGLLKHSAQPSPMQLKKMLLRLFHRIPRLLQRTAVREAVRAMIDVQLRLGEQPSAKIYGVAQDRRLQPTPSFFVKRELEKARSEF